MNPFLSVLAMSFRSLLKGVKDVFWPIHRDETKMFVPMVIMLFLTCLCYNMLKTLKDTVIIADSGAHVIPFIKVWVMLPAAVCATVLFTKLSNKFSQERVFYITISSFLILYVLFAFVLYPNREALHPQALADTIRGILPKGFDGLISMCSNWVFTGFYVLCELWSTMVLTVLFWGFVNEVTKIQKARRFYGALSIYSNVSTICAGQLANYFSMSVYNPALPYGSTAWEQTMMSVVLLVVAAGLIVMGIFWWMNKQVLNAEEFADLHENRVERKTKGKLSMRDSFSYLSNSKYLLCIAFVVIGYNLTINMAEVVWKDRLYMYFGSREEINIYLNNLTSYTGIISTVIALFMAQIIARIGWTWTAIITPLTMFLTCFGFFAFVIFQEQLGPYAISLLGMTPLALSVFFGAAQNCLSKAMKYSVFDTTKEMSFIPLAHDSKLKGKAAIDGVGSRLGKSGGSFLHQGLLLLFGNLSASAPVVSVVILGAISFWVLAVRSLGKQFSELIASQQDEEAAKEFAGDFHPFQKKGKELSSSAG
jgi:AAA family ATP:ADP antiporter